MTAAFPLRPCARHTCSRAQNTPSRMLCRGIGSAIVNGVLSARRLSASACGVNGCLSCRQRTYGEYSLPLRQVCVPGSHLRPGGVLFCLPDGPEKAPTHPAGFTYHDMPGRLAPAALPSVAHSTREDLLFLSWQVAHDKGWLLLTAWHLLYIGTGNGAAYCAAEHIFAFARWRAWRPHIIIS